MGGCGLSAAAAAPPSNLQRAACSRHITAAATAALFHPAVSASNGVHGGGRRRALCNYRLRTDVITNSYIFQPRCCCGCCTVLITLYRLSAMTNDVHESTCDAMPAAETAIDVAIFDNVSVSCQIQQVENCDQWPYVL